ncbi:hypothetical protein C8J56DRAFT_7112 [Mycena floridula]|nr:hypothetical protein C8J56DRAFT_7112 [Mycena floridula]
MYRVTKKASDATKLVCYRRLPRMSFIVAIVRGVLAVRNVFSAHYPPEVREGSQKNSFSEIEGERYFLLTCSRSRCQSIWYCSSACKVRDWKDPRKMCNQSFDMNATGARVAIARVIGCPNADPGFVRKSALWRPWQRKIRRGGIII